MNQIALTIFLGLVVVYVDSALREDDFNKQLKPSFGSEFVKKLQVKQIQRRIDAITRMKHQYSLTSDEVMYTNASIRSFRFLYDLLDNSTLPLSLITLNKTDLHSFVWEEYQQLVRQFNDDFFSRTSYVESIDYEDPESLVKSLRYSLYEDRVFGPSNESTISVVRTYKQALLLLDAYKEDIDYIKDHFSSIVSQFDSKSEKYQAYETESSKNVRRAKFCSKSLSALRDEIEMIQLNGPLSNMALAVLLHRLKTIVNIISMVPTVADLDQSLSRMKETIDAINWIPKHKKFKRALCPTA